MGSRMTGRGTWINLLYAATREMGAQSERWSPDHADSLLNPHCQGIVVVAICAKHSTR